MSSLIVSLFCFSLTPFWNFVNFTSEIHYFRNGVPLDTCFCWKCIDWYLSWWLRVKAPKIALGMKRFHSLTWPSKNLHSEKSFVQLFPLWTGPLRTFKVSQLDRTTFHHPSEDFDKETSLQAACCISFLLLSLLCPKAVWQSFGLKRHRKRKNINSKSKQAWPWQWVYMDSMLLHKWTIWLFCIATPWPLRATQTHLYSHTHNSDKQCLKENMLCIYRRTGNYKAYRQIRIISFKISLLSNTKGGAMMEFRHNQYTSFTAPQ